MRFADCADCADGADGADGAAAVWLPAFGSVVPGRLSDSFRIRGRSLKTRGLRKPWLLDESRDLARTGYTFFDLYPVLVRHFLLSRLPSVVVRAADQQVEQEEWGRVAACPSFFDDVTVKCRAWLCQPEIARSGHPRQCSPAFGKAGLRDGWPLIDQRKRPFSLRQKVTPPTRSPSRPSIRRGGCCRGFRPPPRRGSRASPDRP